MNIARCIKIRVPHEVRYLFDRKIKRCHERLDKEMPLTDHVRSNSDRISAIAMEVQHLLRQAEKEGEDGLVDQAQATMKKVWSSLDFTGFMQMVFCFVSRF